MTITIQRAHGGEGGTGGVSRVTFSPVAIAEFNRTWPGSVLDSSRKIVVTLDDQGEPCGWSAITTHDLNGTRINERVALVDDARELLMTGDRPAWARFSEIVEQVNT